LFEELGLLANAAILLASLLVLDKSSDLTIDNSVKIAEITGIGKTTVGFMLVGTFTSLPELSVSVFAAIGQENIGLAIGNVLGSNIVNICLILGVCFLFASLKNSNKLNLLPLMVKEELGSLYFGLFIASVIPLALVYIGFASRVIGMILLAIFAINTYQLSKIKIVKEEGALGEERQRMNKYLSTVVLGVVGVVASAYFIVESASYIAISIGVPRIVIGATIVAFGTSIPELTTSVNAVKKGHLDLALGNIVGSGFINITCILGVALLGSELTVNMAAFSNLVIFSLMTNLFLWYFISSEKISWREGAVLLFMYFLFLTASFGGYRV